MRAADIASPTVVLDTNVVLDWLVFHNPGCAELSATLKGGGLRWIATAAMRDELAHVLARGHLDAWSPDRTSVWNHWDRHCTELAAPTSTSAPGRLRCSDPDDQKFIDLAVDGRARWLLTRDRAVLRLARRLRDCGIDALTPERWCMPATT